MFESFLAILTIASWGCIRFLYWKYFEPSPASQPMATHAASTTIGPSCLFPRNVFSPCTVFSPLLWLVGTRPRYAANSFSLLNRLTSHTSVRMHMETMGPIPGIVLSRSCLRLYLSVWLILRSCRVASSSVPLMTSTCLMSRSSDMRVSDISSTSFFSHVMNAMDQCVCTLENLSGISTPWQCNRCLTLDLYPPSCFCIVLRMRTTDIVAPELAGLQ